MTDPMPESTPLFPFDDSTIILNDFGRRTLSLGPGTTTIEIAATLYDIRSNAVKRIVGPDAREDGGVEWEGREEAFKEAVRAYARGLNRHAPPLGDIVWIVFDQGREQEQRERVRNVP